MMCAVSSYDVARQDKNEEREQTSLRGGPEHILGWGVQVMHMGLDDDRIGFEFQRHILPAGLCALPANRLHVDYGRKIACVTPNAIHAGVRDHSNSKWCTLHMGAASLCLALPPLSGRAL